MKNIVSRLLAVSTLIISMTGCSTMKYNDPNDTDTGKVWRVQVRDDLKIEPDVAGTKKELESSAAMRKFAADVHLTPERFNRLRVAPTFFRTPGVMGNFVIGFALVPDNIVSEDIRKGAIVDIMYETILDYDKNQFHRVLRLVCRAGDDACIDRVKSEGTLFRVIDANPRPGDLHGLTYDHKTTQEEEQRYLNALKK